MSKPGLSIDIFLYKLLYKSFSYIQYEPVTATGVFFTIQFVGEFGIWGIKNIGFDIGMFSVCLVL